MNLRALARRPIVPAALCLFICTVWLNQSVGLKDFEAIRDRPRDGVVETLRFPLLFLYRQSHDQEIYWATSGAILGRPFDAAVLDRGAVPESFARAFGVADGKLHAPYAEVPFEYPPPALPFILLPRLVTSTFNAYARVFAATMGLCLFAAIALCIRAVRRDDEVLESKGWWIACALVLAHGAIAIQRLDAVVALFVALAVHATATRRPAWCGAWLGLAGAAKIVPLLLAPVLAAADARFYRDKRRLATLALTATAGVAIGLAPMLLASRGALGEFVAYHGKRGLHVESTLGVVYGAVKSLGGHAEPTTLDYGSFNFHSPIADLLAKASMPLTLALVALVAWFAARDASDDDRARRATLAALAGTAALWLGGKVFSPQYLTWGIPLVAAAAGVRHLALSAFVVLLVSQLYFRGFYDHVYEQRPLGVAALVVRQAALVALFVIALRASRARAPT